MQDGIDPCHGGLTEVSAPAWPSRSQSTNDLLLNNVPGVPPREDKPDEETVNPQTPGLSGTSDLTKMRAVRQVLDGVENVGGKEYGKATGL